MQILKKMAVSLTYVGRGRRRGMAPGEAPQSPCGCRRPLKRKLQFSLLFITPIIYSEVSIRFRTIEEVKEALPKSMFERIDVPWEAAFLAGKCFLKYRWAGGLSMAPLPDFF
jgi:hypothetical protein